MPLTQPQYKIIQDHLRLKLQSRDFPKTICPSEVARAFTTAELQTLGAGTWRDTMESVRIVVWELRDNGEVDIMQKGEVLGKDVGLADVKGPIRLRSNK
ncbi:hypothetical protein K504DRAFT_368652 [Pleomassaria siparia CBS 279.74]|uniref:DUF3253 domain-containing protein n=1 Tax=Pleomassaria siparia CBS 279.74 TaxID=1314801 RepID=A0A6G1KKY0_9PLEO|nr:hypothetical protein K504DRAFT_368652 [Pleomassaria siparia CBS 279.74]